MLDWRYIIAPLLTATLIGCKPDFTAELNATDSLMSVLTNVEAHSNDIDNRLVRQYIKDISQKCQKIQNELTDTVALESAQTLVDFCMLDNHLQSCLDRKELIDAEILQTRNNLFNLKTDLKEGRANKDSVNNYIEQEFLYVESLEEGTEQVIVELNSCFSSYAELKEEIDRFIVALPEKVDEID
jgi:chromosome segregation ATPase